MDDQTAKAFISSPISGVIMPITFTALTALVAGLVVGLITKAMDAQLLAAAVVGSFTYLWYMNWWAGKFTEMTAASKPIRHEIVVWLNEHRTTGYTSDQLNVFLTPLKLHNAVVHLANGGGITHRSLSRLGLSPADVTELQEKFLAAGLIEPRGSDPRQGYRLSPRGEQVVKIWATYPSPNEDGGVFWKRQA